MKKKNIKIKLMSVCVDYRRHNLGSLDELSTLNFKISIPK